MPDNRENNRRNSKPTSSESRGRNPRTNAGNPSRRPSAASRKSPAPAKNNERQRPSSVLREKTSREGSSGARVRHIDHIRNVKRKRTTRSALLLWLIVPLFMVVAAAATLYVTDYVAPKPNYAFVTRGVIEHTIGASALIIRDETAYLSSTEGELVTMALEGSRVSKDQDLAMVIPEDAKETAEQLNLLQQQIVDRQRELLAAGKGPGAEAIYDESDTNIVPIINMIRLDAITGTQANLVSYTSSIQVLMDTRDNALQSVDFQDEQLNALLAQKESLESSLATNATRFRAEVPGIVSYKLDGLEAKLSSAAVSVLTPSELDAYLSGSNGTMMSDLHVESNTNAFRICQNAEQYFAMVVPGASVNDFPIDASVDIRITNEGILINDLKVVRSLQSLDGVFIVMQTSSSVERLLDRRTVEIEIIRKSTSGLKVPVASLIDPDYTTGYAQMMYNASGYARLMTVKVNDHDREYAIVEPAEGFDIPNDSTIIITNPQTISEGEKVEQ